MNITQHTEPAGGVQKGAEPEHVSALTVKFIKLAKRAALLGAARQIDAASTGQQARAVLLQEIEELDADLDLLSDADRGMLTMMAVELGLPVGMAGLDGHAKATAHA